MSTENGKSNYVGKLTHILCSHIADMLITPLFYYGCCDSFLLLGGSDYTAVGPFTLTFNSNSSQSFDIPLIDDVVVENTESLNAMLSFPGGIEPPRVSIAQETTQITILDDDCK